MKKIVELELAGKPYTLKVNNRTLASAEEHLGSTMMSVLQNGLGVQAMHTVLWLGMRNYDRKLTLNQVYKMVEDEMEEDPEAYQKLMETTIELILGAMGISMEEEEEAPGKKTKPKASSTSESS